MAFFPTGEEVTLKYNLTDEEMIEQCIDFVKNGQQLPVEFTTRLEEIGLLHIFTEDVCEDL